MQTASLPFSTYTPTHIILHSERLTKECGCVPWILFCAWWCCLNNGRRYFHRFVKIIFHPIITRKLLPSRHFRSGRKLVDFAELPCCTKTHRPKFIFQWCTFWCSHRQNIVQRTSLELCGEEMVFLTQPATTVILRRLWKVVLTWTSTQPYTPAVVLQKSHCGAFSLMILVLTPISIGMFADVINVPFHTFSSVSMHLRSTSQTCSVGVSQIASLKYSLLKIIPGQYTNIEL